ncbi:MAG: MFS transporter [Gammaproteobacteria bacterium]|nr:MFS transporter [Gammaproteobacteria bacterium]
MTPITRRLNRLLDLRPGEWVPLVWAFLYFFALLCSYYILRPLRDEMGIAGGIENLPWVFTGTFIAMLGLVPLFGWISSRYPRRRMLIVVYGFFIVNLLIFYVLFQLSTSLTILAPLFFIWVSVFNLFVVSVFWSLMSDLFTPEQAGRLFAMIAAGGSLGAISGPALTAILVVPFGTSNLLLVSALFLGLAVWCINRLLNWHHRLRDFASPCREQDSTVIGGNWISGVTLLARSPYLLGIGALMLLFTTLSTFLYFQQATLVKAFFDDPAERTRVFALIDLAVNVLTILIQLLITGRLIKSLTLPWTLALIPLLLAGGFLALGYAPVLWVLASVQIIRRAGNYAIMRPAREMLYVVLSREEKYKSKNFIDTVVYRGGDAVSAWCYSALGTLGYSLSSIAYLAVPVALLWAAISYALGKRRRQLAVPNSND